jgi:hypothetical protein
MYASLFIGYKDYDVDIPGVEKALFCLPKPRI